MSFSDSFVENCSTLKSIVGSSPELNEQVLRDHVESVDEKHWGTELEEIFASSRDQDKSPNRDRDKCSVEKYFDEFILMSCLACVGVDREDHLKRCLHFWPNHEDLLNNELVLKFNHAFIYCSWHRAHPVLLDHLHKKATN